MAARRLILVMLVLLGISTVIAMVTPQPDRQDSAEEKGSATGASGATGKSGTTGATGETGSTDAAGTGGATGTSGAGKAGGGPAGSTASGAGGGSAAEATVINPAGSPKTIASAPGERILLLVKVETTAEIEIGKLGRIETATPYAPARFDLVLPTSPGRYRVTDLGTGKVRAEIIARD
jgi:hypothetical protein